MAENDQDKIDAVKNYLSNEFPELPLDHDYDKDLMAPKFSVEESDIMHIVKFTKKCWDDCDADTLIEHLNNLDVANALLKNPGKNVIVNKSINLDFEPK
jgi:hypothetical protein